MPKDKPAIQHKRLAALLDALKEILPALPGFQTLSLFGSLAEGRADEYSDIDLIVTTNDLANARAQLLSTLEQIGPVEFCWVINLRPEEWNPTIVFREESYYHKLDLGLFDVSAEDRTIPAEQTVLLCDRSRPASPAKESGAYVPDHGSMGHFLLSHFLGCTRYLKARKRGQTMTCYRFASAAVDWRLALLYARLTGNPSFRAKLSTTEYLELDRMIGPNKRAELLSEVDYKDVRAMGRTLQTAAAEMLADGMLLAATIGEALPGEVFDRMLRFMDDELKDMGW